METMKKKFKKNHILLGDQRTDYYMTMKGGY